MMWGFSGLWGFLAAWRALFDRFDTDQSGNISYSEFSNALAGAYFFMFLTGGLGFSFID